MDAVSGETSPPTPAYFAELFPKPVTFDPVSTNVSVFFDDANQQVFVVRSNGAGGIIVFDSAGATITLRIDDRGEVFAIRLSPANKVLAVQRAAHAIDFFNYPDGKRDSKPFCQTCKGKTTKINDFFWCSDREIVFVTDLGLEFYDVDADRRSVKCVRTVSIANVNWSLWHTPSKILLISSGIYGNALYTFHYDSGNLTKYNKLEAELPATPLEPRLALLRRDVVLARLYNHVYIIVLKNDAKSSLPAEIVLYKLTRERNICKTNVLKLTSPGFFQLNIVDSLIIVHHLQSQTSFLYDIKFGSLNEQQVCVHQQPLIAPLPLKPFEEKPAFLASMQAAARPLEMYSSNWIFFQPDKIIDPVRGCMHRVTINLNAFPYMIADRCMLIEVLLYRNGAKEIVLEVLREMMRPATASTLSVIGQTFNKINRVYAYNEDSRLDFETLTLMSDAPPADAVITIQQDDIYTHVFSPVFCDPGATASFANKSFPVAVMVEYINSLQLFALPVHFYLYELLVNSLVKCGDLFRLHQFLQYHVMNDSKHLACLLLSIHGLYPPAHQLALDMLMRLGTASDQIVEVFLSNHQVLSALRYLRSIGSTERLHPRKYLSVAKESGDPDVFYSTYKYFEEINLQAYKKPDFLPSDHCQEYEEYFRILFGDANDS